MSFADMELYYYTRKTSVNYVYKNGRKYKKTTTKRVKQKFFDGCYISAVLNKNIAEHIYVIPNNISDLVLNNGLINDYIMHKGVNVELENLEFSKKYKVYSEDEIQARYVLSLSLMEKINNIDTVIEGKKYIIFKENGKVVICVPGLKIENMRKVSMPLNYSKEKVNKAIEKVFEKIYGLFSIYDILDLGNDLYK